MFSLFELMVNPFLEPYSSVKASMEPAVELFSIRHTFHQTATLDSNSFESLRLGGSIYVYAYVCLSHLSHLSLLS